MIFQEAETYGVGAEAVGWAKGAEAMRCLHDKSPAFAHAVEPHPQARWADPDRVGKAVQARCSIEATGAALAHPTHCASATARTSPRRSTAAGTARGRR